MSYNFQDTTGQNQDPSQSNMKQQHIQLKTQQNQSNTTNRPNLQPSSVDNQDKGYLQYFNLQFYQPYFNIPQSEIKNRLKKSLTPWKNNFFDTARQLPDLYGPFWIYTTIIFLLSSIGNLTAYFSNGTKSQYLFRLELVRYGSAIVYTFGFGIPIFLYILLRVFGLNLNIFQIICFYGYSLGCVIPIILLCMIPVSLLEWVFMVYGILNSWAFLVMNLNSQIDILSKSKIYIINISIGCCQIGFFLLLKFVFFNLS